MGKKYVPSSLALNTAGGKASALAKHMKTRRMQDKIHDDSRTTSAGLEERRLILESKLKVMELLAARLGDAKTREDEKARILNYLSVQGMIGCVQGMCLLVDCTTKREHFEKELKDGSKKRGTRRHSLAANIEDVRDMTIEALQLSETTAMLLNDLGLHMKFQHWVDENGVFSSPYFAQTDDYGKKKGKVQATDPEDDAEFLATEDAKKIDEENMDLKAATLYVEGEKKS